MRIKYNKQHKNKVFFYSATGAGESLEKPSRAMIGEGQKVFKISGRDFQEGGPLLQQLSRALSGSTQNFEKMCGAPIINERSANTINSREKLMRITESQLRRLIRETLAEQAEGLDEGFMDKVKGTFGIGSKKKKFDKPGGKMSYYNSPGKQVFDGAVVKGDAKVFEPAKVMGSKCVIAGDALIYEKAVVKNSQVSGPCYIHGNARVEDAVITCDVYAGGTVINGDAKILGGTWHNVKVSTGTWYSYEEFIEATVDSPALKKKLKADAEARQAEQHEIRWRREKEERAARERDEDPSGERQRALRGPAPKGPGRTLSPRENEEVEEYMMRKRDLEREESRASSSNYELSTGTNREELARKRKRLKDTEADLARRGLI